MLALSHPSFALTGHPQGDAPTDFYCLSIFYEGLGARKRVGAIREAIRARRVPRRFSESRHCPYPFSCEIIN
jgi:hypothetical protein